MEVVIVVVVVVVEREYEICDLMIAISNLLA